MRGCIHHVVGIHHWSLGQAVGEASCLHEELENEGQDKPLLKRDSKAHLALRSIIVQCNWLKNAGQHHCNFRCVISWVCQGTPWKCFPLHGPYMRRIFQSSVDFPHKGPVIWTFHVFIGVSKDKLWNKQASVWCFETRWSSYDMTCDMIKMFPVPHRANLYIQVYLLIHRHTTDLEVFHHHINMYAPKQHSFRSVVYICIG